MKKVKVYFHQYWFNAVLHYIEIPTVLMVLQGLCNGIFFLLSSIPVYKGFDIGFSFWENVCLPLDLYIDKKTKRTCIRIPWEFAKKHFPKDYKKNRKGGFVFKEFTDERKELSREVEKEWEESQNSMSPVKMGNKLREKIKSGNQKGKSNRR